MSLTREQKIIVDSAHIDNAVEVGNGEVKANCPFCYQENNKPFKFYINPQGLNICFKCGRRNNVVSFLQEYLNINYSEAKSIVKSKGVLDTYTDYTDSEINNIFVSMINNLSDSNISEKKEMPPLPTNTYSIYENHNLPETKPFIAYLTSRGVTYSQIRKYNINYCINGIVNTTNGKSLNIKNSIVFITNSTEGTPMYWNTRSIEINPFLKTLNASSKNGYSRKDSIFGIDYVNKDDYLVITESVFNALTINDNFRNLKAVATFGKQITDSQIETIISRNPSRIYIGLDPDASKESYELYSKLLLFGFTKDIYMVNYSNSTDDFNDLGRKQSINTLRNATLLNNNSVLHSIISTNLK